MMRGASTNASREPVELTIEEKAFDEANGTYQSVSPWHDGAGGVNASSSMPSKNQQRPSQQS